jgi:elongation factor P
MLNLSEIKVGKNILWEEQPYVVLYHEHSKTGRAGAVLRTKLKNLLTGAVLEKTFQGSEKVDHADMSKSKSQYLYREADRYVFMDNESYEQFFLTQDILGSLGQYLTEGTEVTILKFNGQPVNMELPVKMTLTVTDAPPGIKGDSVSSGDKVVTLETGLKVTTPLFVKEGDRIIVNTEQGTYVSRA